MRPSFVEALIARFHPQRALSRREFLEQCGALVALSLLSGCAASDERMTTPKPAAPSDTAVPTATPRATHTPQPTPTADNLDAQIAQMLMVGFRGVSVSADSAIARDLRAQRIGGVFLFDYDVALDSPVRNVQSPQQLHALTQALQALASVPLLIGIDQEGGKVARLKEKFGFPPTLSAQALGALNDVSKTRAQADVMARTLAQAGVNLNLAPVVDLNTNASNTVIGKLERSFSADPVVVTAHALEVIKAHHAQGVLTTLKHFPGHGSSRDDSHLGFVDVSETWTRAELEPYARIIQAGQADVVMTAHIFNAKLDAHMPATLSKNILTGILRDELKFDGVIMSDDMQMQAITKFYGLETAIEAAINAGVDVLSFANNLVYDPEIAARALHIVKTLVQQDKLSAERINQSYGRILKLKARLR